MYPGRQAQVKLPRVLVQLALALQPPLFSAHSSISEPSQTYACHQRDKCGTIGLCTELRFYAQNFIIYSSLQVQIQGFALGGRTHSPSRPVLFPPFQSPPVLLRSRALNQLGDLRERFKLPQITNYIIITNFLMILIVKYF